jgi:hypothetical protein
MPTLIQTHVLYHVVQRFCSNAQQHKALSYGAQLHRYSETAPVYMHSRASIVKKNRICGALINSSTSSSAAFATDTPAATFTAIYPAGTGSVTSDASGALTRDGTRPETW